MVIFTLDTLASICSNLDIETADRISKENMKNFSPKTRLFRVMRIGKNVIRRGVAAHLHRIEVGMFAE